MGIGIVIATMLLSSIAFEVEGIAPLLPRPSRGLPIGPVTPMFMTPGGA
ncbi:hypothetical protein [Thermaurantiacus sp.]